MSMQKQQQSDISSSTTAVKWNQRYAIYVVFSSIRGVEGGEPVKTLLKPTPFVNKRLHTHTLTGTVSYFRKLVQ